MKWLPKYILLALLLPCLALATQNFQNRRNWQITGVTQPQAAAFLAKLQRYVKTNNRKAIANLIRYPLRHPRSMYREDILRIHQPIANPSAFLEQYDAIMTKRVLNAIKNQKPNKLFPNYQGVMIGNGAVWFTLIRAGWRHPIKIIAINH